MISQQHKVAKPIGLFRHAHCDVTYVLYVSDFLALVNLHRFRHTVLFKLSVD